MKALKLSLILTVATICAIALSNPLLAKRTNNTHSLVVSPTISEVRVYPSGAEVIRRFAVSVQEGRSRIVVKALPTQVRNFKVQTEGISDHARIIDTSETIHYESEAFAEKVKDIDRRIADVNKTIDQYTDELASINMEISLLRGIVEQYPQQKMPDSQQNKFGLERTRDVLGLVREESQEAFEARRAINAKLDEVERERQQLRRERSMIGGQQHETTELAFSVVAIEAKETEFFVSYFVSQASWIAKYHAYLDSNARRLRIVQDAVVRQQSPEPWPEVGLVLSTANPDLETEPPPQISQFVDKLSAGHLTREGAQTLDEFFRTVPWQFNTSEPEEQKNIHFATSYNFSTEYRSAIAQTIMNDGSEHGIVELGRYEFQDIDIATTVVPRHDSVGYLSARFVYTNDIPLPSGELKCFVDGNFIGKVALDSIHPNEDVVIPMGLDRSVNVVVESQGDVKGDKGIFRNRTVEETHFLVVVENRRSSTAKIEVLDFYPIAQHEDIRVDVHRDATVPSSHDIDNRPGRISWTKELDSREVWNIRQRYTVSYPSDSTISVSRR